MLSRIKNVLRLQNQNKPIIVVSGLPRSGTSMMMKMLVSGGLIPITDEIRTADDDNPLGYYEFERVKQLPKGDIEWLRNAPGKVVKVIAMLLRHLPPDYHYQIIFMRRALPEIIASQRRMLINRGEDPDEVGEEELIHLFERHLREVYAWMNKQPNVLTIDVDYNQLMGDPGTQSSKLGQFLNMKLDDSKMASVVDPTLYRQRMG